MENNKKFFDVLQIFMGDKDCFYIVCVLFWNSFEKIELRKDFREFG